MLSEAHRSWQMRRYYTRKSLGLCTRCGKVPQQKGQKECNDCRKAHQKSYKKRCEKAKDYSRTKGRKNRALWWNQVLQHYGAKCSCCGETERMFLTLDHVNNDGYQHRLPSGGRMKAEKLYRWLILNNFPEGYQILCWNCNCGKHRNGGICPHTSK